MGPGVWNFLRLWVKSNTTSSGEFLFFMDTSALPRRPTDYTKAEKHVSPATPMNCEELKLYA